MVSVLVHNWSTYRTAGYSRNIFFTTNHFQLKLFNVKVWGFTCLNFYLITRHAIVGDSRLILATWASRTFFNGLMFFKYLSTQVFLHLTPIETQSSQPELNLPPRTRQRNVPTFCAHAKVFWSGRHVSQAAFCCGFCLTTSLLSNECFIQGTVPLLFRRCLEWQSSD